MPPPPLSPPRKAHGGEGETHAHGAETKPRARASTRLSSSPPAPRGGLRGGRVWVACALLVYISAACAPTPTSPVVPAGSTPETLSLAGSTATIPLLRALGLAFQEDYPAASLAGLDDPYNATLAQAAVAEGTLPLAAISGAPSPDLWSAPVAVDALAVIVHADNPLSSLTLTELHRVFSGRTWRWSELDVEIAADLGQVVDEIEVISREVGSGTRAAFEELVLRERPEDDPTPMTTMAVLRFSSDEMVAYVAEHPAAIGYVALGVLDVAPFRGDSERGAPERGAQVKALAIEDVAPGPEQVANGDYPLSLPLFFVARSEPGGVERSFLDFCLSRKGQRLVAQRYAPVRE